MKRGLPETAGSVLVVVLVICLGLVSVTLLFGHSMAMTFRGADNDVAARQAEQAIEGAARFAMTLMLNAETPGTLPDITTYESEGVPVGEATFWFLGQPDFTKNNNGPVLGFGLVDEASKLNLNTATVEMLMVLPGMTEELASAIVDWRDDNDEVTGSTGAESETYQRLQPPYTCKNAPFESIEELALLNGAHRQLVYGEDANLNGALEPNEDDGDKTLPADDSNGIVNSGIFSYLTCFSREPTTQSDGTTGRINVTDAASRQALQTLLEEKIPARAADILAALGQTPATSVLDFSNRGALTAEEYALIYDAIRGPQTEGLINVNTASEAVLACVPGIGADKAQMLVAVRPTRDPITGTNWVGTVLDQAAIDQAGPFLTGRSYQVSADVAAVGRHGRGYRRARLIIDLMEATPRIVYRRNLSPLGWALGADVRQMLAERKEIR
jgi:DNA uptake protein ComE-like DNA-binding protein